MQGTLEAIVTTGTLRFDINPPVSEAQIRIQRDGDPTAHEVTAPAVSVPEGHYTVSVSAPQYLTTTTAVQVSAGGTFTVAVPCAARRPEAPPAATAGPTSGWTFGSKPPVAVDRPT